MVGGGALTWLLNMVGGKSETNELLNFAVADV